MKAYHFRVFFQQFQRMGGKWRYFLFAHQLNGVLNSV